MHVSLLLLYITGRLSMCLVNLSNESCRPKTQLMAFDPTDKIPKSPIGLQQCERECFTDTNCHLMVYNVNNLTCYKESNIGATATQGQLDFVLKLRSEIASNLETSYLCRNQQCESGFSCFALSSGDSVCIAELCGEPVSIKNAVVNADSYSISSIATYSCNNGYYSIGTRDITCGSSLEWTETILVCCKNGFTYDQGTQLMFKVISEKKKYTDALGYCAGLGAGLVKANTTQRMVVLRDCLSVERYYTDLSDRATEGTWIHSDGSYVNMSLFHTGEPNGGTVENCAVISNHYNYYDVSCYSARPFICEVK